VVARASSANPGVVRVRVGQQHRVQITGDLPQTVGEAMNSLGYFRDVINHVPLLSMTGGPLTSGPARGDRSRLRFLIYAP